MGQVDFDFGMTPLAVELLKVDPAVGFITSTNVEGDRIQFELKHATNSDIRMSLLIDRRFVETCKRAMDRVSGMQGGVN